MKTKHFSLVFRNHIDKNTLFLLTPSISVFYQQSNLCIGIHVLMFQLDIWVGKDVKNIY
jgi:hypothetical protein